MLFQSPVSSAELAHTFCIVWFTVIKSSNDLADVGCQMIIYLQSVPLREEYSWFINNELMEATITPATQTKGR